MAGQVLMITRYALHLDFGIVWGGRPPLYSFGGVLGTLLALFGYFGLPFAPFDTFGLHFRRSCHRFCSKAMFFGSRFHESPAYLHVYPRPQQPVACKLTSQGLEREYCRRPHGALHPVWPETFRNKYFLIIFHCPQN